MASVKHFGKIVCLLLSLMTCHIADAQQPLAQQAFTVFEQHCMDCHSEYGAYADALVIKHAVLLDTRAVVPGQPDASELYARLLSDTAAIGSQMPLGQEPLKEQEIAIIRRWIAAGAPDWTDIPKPERRFITTEAMLNTIHSHLKSLTDFDREFARYFTLTHLYNAGARDDNLRAYRNALSKLINSLSWGKRVRKPKPIDSEETIFYIDLRHYEWDSQSDPWYKIEQAYPYGIDFNTTTYTALCRETDCELPFIRADWFIATASVPPLYYEILDLPTTEQALETYLGVNVDANIKNAPGLRVVRAGFNESGVSRNNRVVERHESRYGAYWKSYDFAGNAGKQNIFMHPLSFTHDGGEIIFNLPNGLQAYYLSTGSGARLDTAPIEIVSNAGARDPVVRNGLSCMGCHTEGLKTFEDQIRLVVERTPNLSDDRAQALRLYAEKPEMDILVREDVARYREALEAAGGIFGGTEPIQQLVKQFEGPLNAAAAAAEVGLLTSDFRQKIRERSGLQRAGLTVLDVPNGSVKRDAWASQFGAVISALNLRGQTGMSDRTPTVTQPSIIQSRTRQPTPGTSRSAASSPSTDMVLIPAGSFQMGSTTGELDEKPVHTVYVDAFYMDTYEVTNAQYKKFIDANPQWRKDQIPRAYHNGFYLNHWNGNTYPVGKANHPVVYVSWYAAMAYAKWAGKRLPTEAEWEKAARGGLRGKKYPWGDSIDSNQANFGNNVKGTTAVGMYPANGYGLYDMAGNVWEWCIDEYDSEFYGRSPRQNPISGASIARVIANFTSVKINRVLRGGSWSWTAQYVRVASRFGNTPSLTLDSYGFRCVRAVSP